MSFKIVPVLTKSKTSKMKVVLTLFLVGVSLTILQAQSLITYKGPAGVAPSNLYLITLSQNGVSKPSFVYSSNAGNTASTELNDQLGKTFNFTEFSFTGSVTVKVTKIGSSASSATIRPNRVGIGVIKCVSNVSGSTVKFTMSRPGKLSVEFDDDASLSNPLMVFGDTIEDTAKVPNKLADNVFIADDSSSLKSIPINKTIVYFAPGVHVIGQFKIPEQISQVYVSGGAMIEGYFYADRKTSGAPLMINGRGVVSQSIFPYHYPDKNPKNGSSKAWYKAVEIYGGRGHLVEGLTFIDGSAYYVLIQADDSKIDNVKVNGFKYNNDAFTLSGSNITLSNCFARSNDDAVVLYTSNLIIGNCVFWQLRGSIIQLGWRPHTMGGVNLITDCDVLHTEWANWKADNLGFMNAMNAIKADRQEQAVIQNFTIRNIYFDTPLSRFIDISGCLRWGRQSANSYTLNDKPWVYKNFKFQNIHFNNGSVGVPSNLIHLEGFNEQNPVTDFSFKDIYFNGKKLADQGLFNNKVMNKKNFRNFIFQ